ncbi:MAG: hypothetical protein E6J26_11465, partial [Chloroflexi bacterium]
MFSLIALGLLMGFSFAAPPGVVAAETMRRGVSRGFHAALGVQLGSLVGDATYALLALAGLAVLVQQPLAQRVLGVLGAVYLLYIAAASLRQQLSLRPDAATSSPADSRRGAFRRLLAGARRRTRLVRRHSIARRCGDLLCQFLRRLRAVRILHGPRRRLCAASAVRSARAHHLAGVQPGHRRARRRLRTAGAGAMAERVSSRTRAATPCDAAAIARIYNDGIADRIATFETRLRTADDIRAWFDGVHPIVVATDQEDIIAFASTSTYRPRECYAG